MKPVVMDEYAAALDLERRVDGLSPKSATVALTWAMFRDVHDDGVRAEYAGRLLKCVAQMLREWEAQRPPPHIGGSEGAL